MQERVALPVHVDKSEEIFSESTITQHIINDLDILTHARPRKENFRSTTGLFLQSLLLFPAFLHNKLGDKAFELTLVKVDTNLLDESLEQGQIDFFNGASAKLEQVERKVLFNLGVLLKQFKELNRCHFGGRCFESLHLSGYSFKQG